MPALTIQEAFGTTASDDGTTTTITWADFPELDQVDMTASQKVAALLQYWGSKTEWRNDPEKGIAPANFQNGGGDVDRDNDGVLDQKETPFGISAFSPKVDFDPDDVI